MVINDVSSPGFLSTRQDDGHIELQTPAMDETWSAETPTEGFGLDTVSWDPLTEYGDIIPDLSLSNLHPPKGSVSQIQIQNSVTAADEFGTMYSDRHLNDLLNIDPFLGSSNYLPSSSPIQHPSATSLLLHFGEKMERRVSTMSGFLTDSQSMMENCPENDSMGMSAENPVSAVLTSTKEFIDIIESLTTAARYSDCDSQTSSELVRRDVASKPPSTEITLLILSSYLTLMRVYDSLFHDVYRCLCQMEAETIKSLKVKAVLRIGGISTLQDMSARAYAVGIVDAIQSQIQDLERCMGLPAAYCLSGEATEPAKGIFADKDRLRLLHTVMAQEDTKSKRGNTSYAECLRENMMNSVALFSR